MGGKNISRLKVTIQARDREIFRLSSRLDDYRAQQAPIYEVRKAYYCQLHKAIMTMCNGGDHSLRAAGGPIDHQRREIVGLRNRLRYYRASWSLYSGLATAAITDIDAPGLTYTLSYVTFSLSGFPTSSHSGRRRPPRRNRFG